MFDRYAWNAGNNGANKMRWFVWRDRRPDDPQRGPRGSTEYLYGSGSNHASHGRLRRFASMAAAQKVADALNALEEA